jgi:putative transposase
MNHKLVLRLLRENDWLVRRRQRSGWRRFPGLTRSRGRGRNQAWAMDFVSDSLAAARRFRVLCVVDRITRECLLTEVDTSLTGQRVVAVLNLLVAMRGKPEAIRVDNGPESISQALDAWAFENALKLHFITSGLGSRLRTRTSKASTGACATNASISIGFWISTTRGRRSSSGDAITTNSGRTAH